MQSVVPIFKQGRYLVATVPAEATDGELADLRDSLVDKVARSHSSGVIIDVTEMDVIDSFAARTLQDLAELTRRRGAPTVVVGIQPEVAHAMETVGLKLEETAEDIAEGLAHLDAATR
jgi:rsbT antagonist protein RsbS